MRNRNTATETSNVFYVLVSRFNKAEERIYESEDK